MPVARVVFLHIQTQFGRSSLLLHATSHMLLSVVVAEVLYASPAPMRLHRGRRDEMRVLQYQRGGASDSVNSASSRVARVVVANSTAASSAVPRFMLHSFKIADTAGVLCDGVDARP